MGQDKKRFSEDFPQWVGILSAGVRLMIEHPVTGEEYWISREKFLEGYEAGNSSVHSGATAYEIYAAVTSDNPILSESDWVQSLYGQDGETPFVGPNGNWWTGTTDTGIRAQSTVITPTITISGIKKGMTIEWFDPDNIPTGFVLSDGNYKNNFAPINGILIPDKRGKLDRGYDPDALADPKNTDGTTKNYGKVGNTGGADSIALTKDNIPSIDVPIPAESSGDDNNHSWRERLASSDRGPGITDQEYTLTVKTKAGGVDVDVRNAYRVACYITKISDDDQSTEGGSLIDPMPGTNVSINKDNPAKPVISVDLSNYYTKEEVDEKLADVSGLTATQVKTISRTLITASSASTSTITLDVANQVQSDTNNGTTDVALALSNLPAVSCESFLTVKNVRAAAFNLVLPTSTFTSGGITYSFTLMVATPLAISASKSAELHFIFVFIDETHCNIRIAGGVEI